MKNQEEFLEFKIFENNFEIVLQISTKPFEEIHQEIYIDTKYVRKWLQNNDYQFGKCSRSSVISNTSANKLTGEWRFVKLKESPEFDDDFKPKKQYRKSRKKIKIEED